MASDGLGCPRTGALQGTARWPEVALDRGRVVDNRGAMLDVGLVGSLLDRADALRSDLDALERLAQQPDARLLLLDGLEPAVTADGTLEWSSLAALPPGVDLALLGLLEGRGHFVALTPISADVARSRSPFGALDLLTTVEASTYAAARSLVDWHARHRYCARCGHDTTTFRAGWGRRCTGCRAEHYPRTDPVVIMLAEHEGRVLVGRQPRFPPRFYSALAGFVEVGESLEAAVARELFEEAGVRARAVRYVASQPWPFPSSLMLACVAEVDGDALTLDGTELEDAMWVTRAEVVAALAGAADARFLVPPPYAVAHTLLRHWSEESAQTDE